MKINETSKFDEGDRVWTTDTPPIEDEIVDIDFDLKEGFRYELSEQSPLHNDWYENRLAKTENKAKELYLDREISLLEGQIKELKAERDKL